jgi:hypothetical protein
VTSALMCGRPTRCVHQHTLKHKLGYMIISNAHMMFTTSCGGAANYTFKAFSAFSATWGLWRPAQEPKHVTQLPGALVKQQRQPSPNTI